MTPSRRLGDAPCGYCSWGRAVGEAERAAAGATWYGVSQRAVRWGGTEVVVLQPVAVALQREDLGMVDESVAHRRGGGTAAGRSRPTR